MHAYLHTYTHNTFPLSLYLCLSVSLSQVTNVERIKTGIEKKACSGLLLKVNQIGTITEAVKACTMSHDQGWGVMVSHRSFKFMHNMHAFVHADGHSQWAFTRATTTSSAGGTPSSSATPRMRMACRATSFSYAGAGTPL